MRIPSQINVLSPAKVNLMLRVLGKMDNGYHKLQTYFMILNWGDEMSFEFTDSNKIQISGDFPNLKTEENLIFKAIKSIQPFQKVSTGLSIHVEKNIPQGSGLGGGSSNAAKTLSVLNNEWQCNLTLKQLINIGQKLGADVPIFLLNQAAMAEGIGEKLTPYSIGSFWLVLIFPNESVNTKSVFQNPMLFRDREKIELNQINNPSNWINDCTPVVLKEFPKIKECYDHSKQFADIYMSGTGSTLFSIFKSKNEAIRFQNSISKNYQTIICKNIL